MRSATTAPTRALLTPAEFWLRFRERQDRKQAVDALIEGARPRHPEMARARRPRQQAPTAPPRSESARSESARAGRLRAVFQPRLCVVCGWQFTPRSGNQRMCTPGGRCREKGV